MLKARWLHLEEQVLKWVLEERAAGRGLSKLQLCLHAQVVTEEMNINGATYTQVQLILYTILKHGCDCD